MSQRTPGRETVRIVHALHDQEIEFGDVRVSSAAEPWVPGVLAKAFLLGVSVPV